MSIPQDRLYTSEHEWIRGTGDTGGLEAGGEAAVGITDHAQDALGDVVFVELPKVGATLRQGESFGVVESVKSVSDLYSPADGVVSAVNDTLIETPELLNQDPYGQGWIIRLTLATLPPDLLDASSYRRVVDA